MTLFLYLSHTLYLSPYLALSLSLSEIYAHPPLDGDHLTKYIYIYTQHR